MSLFDKYEVNTDAESYRFEEPGDKVEGKVTNISGEVAGKFGAYKFVTLDTEEGKKKIIISSILRTKLEDSDVAVGDTVGVRYEGLKTSKSGNQYKDWGVIVVKPESDSLFD